MLMKHYFQKLWLCVEKKPSVYIGETLRLPSLPLGCKRTKSWGLEELHLTANKLKHAISLIYVNVANISTNRLSPDPITYLLLLSYPSMCRILHNNDEVSPNIILCGFSITLNCYEDYVTFCDDFRKRTSVISKYLIDTYSVNQYAYKISKLCSGKSSKCYEFWLVNSIQNLNYIVLYTRIFWRITTDFQRKLCLQYVAMYYEYK